MTREQKMAKAKAFRDEGWTLKQIAAHFNVSTTTVFRWVEPERTAAYRNGRACNPGRARAYDRLYNAEHRGECPQCGGDMSRATAHAGGICRACHSDRADATARQIERWWAEGRSLHEIRAELGWTKGHIASQFDRLRAAGYDLPYRRKGKRMGTKFPDQVPA